MNEDGKALHRTSITPGAQLRLNLCLQLKNFTSIVPAKVIVYLILACQETVESGNIESEAKMSCRDEQIDDMIELNEKLWNYVIHRGNRTSAFDSSSSTGSHRYARFELNERGQGFSTCILDVSDLHPGCCYRIKWQCGYINTEGFCCSLLPENSGQPLFTILEQKIPLSTVRC
ncbi:hypothetical protein M569_05236 [Genlisea aurea]|uniref:Integrator complex subunit 7-like C-terminal domain-containing protein n=1 Tax=Genlisea aurea TaxID=192259 RepID=S8EAH8_9LAMI|nr:hypothetical protein M569_05236 [Genlisea aurea]